MADYDPKRNTDAELTAQSGSEKPALEWVRQDTGQWGALREEFIAAQNGQCAICRRPFTTEMPGCLDHCHVSGFLRGALCDSCNTKLGWAEKHRHAIDAYLHRAGEFQAYRVRPFSGPLTSQQQHAKARSTIRYGAPEWVRRYWQERAIGFDSRRQTPKDKP